MGIRQNITSTDIEIILKQLEKPYKRTATVMKLNKSVTFFFVFLGTIFQLLALIFNHKAFVFLIFFAQLIAIYYHKIKYENWRKSKSILQLNNIKYLLPNSDIYNINANEKRISINDLLFLDWQNICCALLNEDYIILSDKNQFAVPIKVDTKLKKDICSLLDRNNITIISLNLAELDAEFVKQTKIREKKRTLLVDRIAVIILLISLICLIYGINNRTDNIDNNEITKENTEQKYSSTDFIYDPDKSFVMQMEDAYDLTKNADYSFDLYFPYIMQQDYNTMIKIHKGSDESYASYHNEADIYFFDNEEFKLGLKLDSSYDTLTGNILYTTSDKSFYLQSNGDGTFIKNEMNSNYVDWKTRFYNILEIDDTTANKIDWSYKTNHGISFSSTGKEIYPGIVDFTYEFCGDHIIYTQEAEYADEFIIMFRNTDESEIDNISNLFESAMDNNSQIILSDLIQTINDYFVISLGTW